MGLLGATVLSVSTVIHFRGSDFLLDFGGSLSRRFHE